MLCVRNSCECQWTEQSSLTSVCLHFSMGFHTCKQQSALYDELTKSIFWRRTFCTNIALADHRRLNAIHQGSIGYCSLLVSNSGLSFFSTLLLNQRSDFSYKKVFSRYLEHFTHWAKQNTCLSVPPFIPTTSSPSVFHQGRDSGGVLAKA